jgi:hypothetical protein
MTYKHGDVNGMWRLKPTGGDHMAIGKETPAPESRHGESSCVYGANGEVMVNVTNSGNPFDGKPTA